MMTFNGPRQEGAGYFQLTAVNGRRCSTAVGFLRPAQRRPNLTVITQAPTESLIIENKTAVGVRYRHAGTTHEARADAEVILSAGAIGSPQILQLSGIADGSFLQSKGIETVHHLPGVGNNMQDHLQIRAVYKTKHPTLNNEVNNPFRKALIGLEYIFFRRGPMSMGASQVGVFARTRPDLDRPDVQFHVQPLSADSPGEGLHRYAAFTSSVCQLRPESRGHLAIRSKDPNEHPEIHPNYLSAPIDQEVTVAAMKLSRRICETSRMEREILEELKPGPDIQTDEQLLDHARNVGTTIYHPCSTCKMGNDDGAVVDERLRVRGIANLRVADASIMPIVTSGNTNAPTIMIGEKAADMILADNR